MLLLRLLQPLLAVRKFCHRKNESSSHRYAWAACDNTARYYITIRVMETDNKKATYVTHVSFGTRGSLGALSPRRRLGACRSLVLNLGSTCLAAVRVGLRSIKVFGFRVANLQRVSQ